MEREELRYVSLLIDDDRSGSEFHEPTCFNYVYTIPFHYIFLSLLPSHRLYLAIVVVYVSAYARVRHCCLRMPS